MKYSCKGGIRMYVCKINDQSLVFTDEILEALWLTDSYISHFYKLFLGYKTEFRNNEEKQCNKELYEWFLKSIHRCGLELTSESSPFCGERYYFFSMGRPELWLSPEVWEMTKYPEIAKSVATNAEKG